MTAQRSQPLGEALVVEIADPDGRPWIAKAARRRKQYEAELSAYREWVPALGDRAPALRASDDELHLLVLERLPGQPADESDRATDPDVFRQAGRLTRRLHESAPPVPCHLDNHPRNWLIDETGTVRHRLIDFGNAERDLWI